MCRRPVCEWLDVRAARPRSHDGHLGGCIPDSGFSQDERQVGATTGGSDSPGGRTVCQTSAPAQKLAKMFQCSVPNRQADHRTHQIHGEGCPAWPALEDPRARLGRLLQRGAAVCTQAPRLHGRLSAVGASVPRRAADGRSGERVALMSRLVLIAQGASPTDRERGLAVAMLFLERAGITAEEAAAGAEIRTVRGNSGLVPLLGEGVAANATSSRTAKAFRGSSVSRAPIGVTRQCSSYRSMPCRRYAAVAVGINVGCTNRMPARS